MKTYDVTIKAEIYKTITVTAEDENSAYVEAHEVFSGYTQKARPARHR